MLAPVHHILPLTTIRRERTLPVPGRITARLDQKVSSLDIVAEASLGSTHKLIDVAQQLGVRAEKAQELMQVKAGDLVTANQTLAAKSGLSPQIVRAPRDGRVLLVSGGQILLEVGEGTFELMARLPGTVSRHVPERGVEITFTGSLVQGVWGNGRVDLGLLLPLLQSPADVLTASMLDVSMRGAVLLAGHCSEAAALKTAAELPARGLILGSMSPLLIPQAQQLQMPILLTDGFGKRPMNAAAYKLLSTNEKRETTVNAEALNRQSGSRPEVYIPLPVTQEPPLPREVETFAPNQPVRILRAPYAGQTGSLTKLLPGLTAFPSGLRLPAAEVRLESGEIAVVPTANLEVLG